MSLLEKNTSGSKNIDALEAARLNMIKNQIMPSRVINPQIINVINTIPRHIFVTKELEHIAYIDEDVPITDNRFLMAPVSFARLLDALDINEKDNILDIGCNTGYSSAIFSKLAKKVVAIENDPDLASRANLCLNKLSIDNVIVISDKLAQGHIDSAPYDAVFINGSVESVPDSLFDQLGEKGRLITVIKNKKSTGCATIFEKYDKKVYKRILFDINLPLIEGF